MDENLAHCSYEAGILEDPNVEAPKDMWKLTVDPTEAPDTPEDFTLHFTKGLPSKLEYSDKGNKKTVTDATELFLATNAIARRNGVGRIDIVENRFIGLKSRAATKHPVSPASAPPTSILRVSSWTARFVLSATNS